MTRIVQRYNSGRVQPGDTIQVSQDGKVAGGQGTITIQSQWYVNGLLVEGETDKIYTVRPGDNHKKIICIQTATDETGRTLLLKPSNEIFVGIQRRKPSGTKPCPPKEEIPCPTPPPIKRTVPAVKRDRPQAKQASRSGPIARKSTASADQIKKEMRRAGGCSSCAERARRRREAQGK